MKNFVYLYLHFYTKKSLHFYTKKSLHFYTKKSLHNFHIHTHFNQTQAHAYKQIKAFRSKHIVEMYRKIHCTRQSDTYELLQAKRIFVAFFQISPPSVAAGSRQSLRPSNMHLMAAWSYDRNLFRQRHQAGQSPKTNTEWAYGWLGCVHLAHTLSGVRWLFLLCTPLCIRHCIDMNQEASFWDTSSPSVW